MAQPADPARSFADLYERIRALPAGMTGEILEPGEIRVMSRPGRRHRRTAKAMLRSLGPLDEDGDGAGWWIEVEAEVRFPGDRLAVPDLSAWRVDRVAELPEENPITILPDWCCEILSPTTARGDKRLKLPMYAGSGVPWSWLVDPELCLLEVYETLQGRAALTLAFEGDETATLPPFGVEFALGRWWPPKA